MQAVQQQVNNVVFINSTFKVSRPSKLFTTVAKFTHTLVDWWERQPSKVPPAHQELQPSTQALMPIVVPSGAI